MKEYIEREALYSEIVPHFKSANAFGSSRNVCKAWGKMLDMVQNAPAADVVERKRGKWYWAEDGHCKCSVCGQYATVKRLVVKTNFCPNCGADMREVVSAND